jgi:hypothetical protein
MLSIRMENILQAAYKLKKWKLDYRWVVILFLQQ